MLKFKKQSVEMQLFCWWSTVEIPVNFWIIKSIKKEVTYWGRFCDQ